MRTQYGALMLVDLEEEYYAEQAAKLVFPLHHLLSHLQRDEPVKRARSTAR